MIVGSALALVGCARPYADVAARERPWWEDTARLEALAGLDLVEIPAGDPIGRWPRVVLGRDRVDVDDRAWFLDLPPEVLARPAAAEALVEVTLPVLADGGDPTDPELARALDRLRERMSAVAPERVGDELLVVPDASLGSGALVRALRAAREAGFEAFTLVGAASGRLRSAEAVAPVCPTTVLLTVDRQRPALALSAGPRLLPPGGSCSASPLELVDAAERLGEACGPAWDRLAARPAASPGDDEGWRCVDVTVLVGDTDAASVLRVLSALRSGSELVRSGWIGSVPDPAPCEGGVPVDELSDAALDVVCAGPAVRRWREGDRRSVDVVPARPSPEVRAAFPAWAATPPVEPP